ncbi:MAG: hypothetical protein KDK63_00180 [Chlamydiia bacterium]|nr:hypothetical protein [Chlamydiia bacterium]
MTAIVTATRYLNPMPLVNIAWRCKKTVAIASLILGAAIPYYLYYSICAPRTEENAQGPKVINRFMRVFTPPDHNQITEIKDLRYVEERSDLRIIADRYVVEWKDLIARLWSVWERLRDVCRMPSGIYVTPENITFANNSIRLYVFVHGLRGHPSHWNTYSKAIAAKDSQADVMQVYVPHSGNCSCREATDAIFQKIQAYVEDRSDRKVALIGTSRGGPLVLDLADQIHTQSPNTKVFVATIAGANHGSRFMNWINKIPLINRMHDETLRAELEYNETTRYKLQEGNASKEYHAYTAVDDRTVVPFTSSLLHSTAKNVHNYVVRGGEGHISIVDHVQEDLVNKCVAFMKSG